MTHDDAACLLRAAQILRLLCATPGAESISLQVDEDAAVVRIDRPLDGDRDSGELRIIDALETLRAEGVAGLMARLRRA